MTPGVGDRAPEFSLPADDWSNEVSLSELNAGGPVVLFFYPGDWSSVCSDQLGFLQASLELFSQRGASVAAVSADSPWSHRAFAEQRGITFPLLSDFRGDALSEYGVQHERGFPERAYFVIDSEGVIRTRRVEDSPGEQPPLNEVLADLDEAL
ncbi:redoxin domain-containing protein [Rubrobacter aplysinae]|uniref:redoxin domain-containing protein n=1 Tax=Rubrobacter aplysinae TaxID=909625 RepID=UPI00064B9D03|nr:redoxin domain-containing protein [Rubrobacter aplysinae]